MCIRDSLSVPGAPRTPRGPRNEARRQPSPGGRAGPGRAEAGVATAARHTVARHLATARSR
eukprot:3399150-Lingulodinium_polyedra.AAC.1